MACTTTARLRCMPVRRYNMEDPMYASLVMFYCLLKALTPSLGHVC